MGTLIWFVFGFLTAYLMYGKKEEIPVFKAALVIFFGILSFIVWVLGNLNVKIQNPLPK